MNWSFYALFFTLAVMLFLTSANIHVCALFALSIGLFLSIKWSVELLPPRSPRRVPPNPRVARFLVQIADVEEVRRVERLAKEASEAKAGKAE